MFFSRKKKLINDLPYRAVERGGVIVDVRTREEFEEGHIPEAINRPVDEIYMWSQDLGKKDDEFYLYCYSGARCSRAVRQLKREGYSKLVNCGGIKNYKGTLAR